VIEGKSREGGKFNTRTWLLTHNKECTPLRNWDVENSLNSAFNTYPLFSFPSSLSLSFSLFFPPFKSLVWLLLSSCRSRIERESEKESYQRIRGAVLRKEWIRHFGEIFLWFFMIYHIITYDFMISWFYDFILMHKTSCLINRIFCCFSLHYFIFCAPCFIVFFFKNFLSIFLYSLFYS
jgi:hypothetical protein